MLNMLKADELCHAKKVRTGLARLVHVIDFDLETPILIFPDLVGPVLYYIPRRFSDMYSPTFSS